MSETATPLGVAVVGLGVGEQHAHAYLRTGRCMLYWVYDLDASKAKRIAVDLGASVAQSLTQILADPRVEVLSIASYDDHHAAQVVAALKAGKHVFVEKPLCCSLDEAQSIKAQWASSGRHLVSNLVLRGAPLFQWLRDTIASGRLGTLYAFDGDYLYGRLHKITDGWRKNVLDYSVIQGGGIHLVDLMLWLTGDRPTHVTAVGSRVCTARSAFRYDDFVAATFRFRSGLIGRISANFGCVHRHQHVVRLFGTGGTFVSDDCGARVHWSRDPRDAPMVLNLSPLPETKGVLVPGFVDAVLNGDRSPEATQYEFDLISICLSADRALASGREESVHYV